MVSSLLAKARLNTLGLRIFQSKSALEPVENIETTQEEEENALRASLAAEAEYERRSQEQEKLLQIAEASVQLASLGPRLAKLVAEMETQAQDQARRATAIAETMESLTKDLERAIAELRNSSGQVQDALATVSRIADHTRIISLNASIEAARAGIHGRAFAVVVEEVQRLADRTGSTTHLIEDRMHEMQTSIVRVEKVTGHHAENLSTRDERSVEAVNQDVHGMAKSAESQLGAAHNINHLGGNVNELAESLLLSVGSFRFKAHAQAEREVGALVPDLSSVGENRRGCEEILERWLLKHPHFELAYLTDASGRQFIDNICREGDRISHDKTGYGKNWSQRPWYLAALDHVGVYSTDIYRSTATGDFCFTVAVALKNEDGKPLGVFGADVNFHRLLTS